MIEFVKTVASKIDVNKTSCKDATFDNGECIDEIGSIRGLIEEEKRKTSVNTQSTNVKK